MWFPGAYRYPRWRSDRAFVRGDSERAISILAAYLKRRPRDPMSWLLVGAALDRAGRRKEAEDRLREGLQRHPAFNELRIRLAQVLFMQWMFEEARQQWGLVLQSNPASAEAYEGLAASSLWEGKQEEARTLIEESIRRKPDAVLSMDLALLLVCLPGGRSQAEALLRNAAKAKGFRRDLSRICFSPCSLRRRTPILRQERWHSLAGTGIESRRPRWNDSSPSTGKGSAPRSLCRLCDRSRQMDVLGCVGNRLWDTKVWDWGASCVDVDMPFLSVVLWGQADSVAL